MKFVGGSGYHVYLSLLVVGTISLALQACHARPESGGTRPSDQIGMQVVPKDAFPVFHNPRFVDATTAEKKRYVHDRDPVIGVAIEGRAKAYPIRTMGIHELGNDTLGTVPIAVGW